MTSEQIEFERDKVCFEQNHAQMRLLSDQMSKIPTISITITGGLWFASGLKDVDLILKFGLLIFAGVVNTGLILSCFRVRDVIASYFEQIKKFSPENFADGNPTNPVLKGFSQYSMISIYASLMMVAATMSFVTAIIFYWPFGDETRWIGWVVLVIFALIITIAIIGRNND